MGEFEAILVDLFGGQRGEDAAQVAFERILGNVLDFGERDAQESLQRVAEQRLVAGDLDIGDALHRQRDAAFGVRIVDRYFEGNRAQVEAIDFFEERDAKGAAPLNHAVAHRATVGRLAFAAREDDDLVGLADKEVQPDDADHHDQRHREN